MMMRKRLAQSDVRPTEIDSEEAIGSKRLLFDIPSTDRRHPRKLYITSAQYFCVLFFLGTLYFLVLTVDKKLPHPLLKVDEANNLNRFIAERAMGHILNLTSLGPRPVGSFANEVLAVNILTKEINGLINKADKIHQMSLDIQKVSGAFPLNFLDGMTNVYSNVQNVIVKIGPRLTSRRSLLLNCHYDSFPDSPGASDDSAGCAVMLEVLRVISQSSEPLVDNIIFLFNGAEESLLQASHGFITQHKWASEVRAFINLEACGAGGRELLFQSGPENPWLMEAYAESVPYPVASTLAQEIFQSGLIPGQTDYRIFRDYGNVPGLDFAWAKNGYIYHTKLDNAGHIPLGSLQRTGDNILALTYRVLDKLIESSSRSRGNNIYFDFLGFFIIHFPGVIAFIGGSLLVAASSYLIITKRIDFSQSRMKYFDHLLHCVIATVCGNIATLVVSVIISKVIIDLHRGMSWYTSPIWVFFLYVIPALGVPLAIIKRLTASMKKLNRWELFILYHTSNQVLWTLCLFVCLLLNIRSGFLPGIWILFSLPGFYLRDPESKWGGGIWILFSLPGFYLRDPESKWGGGFWIYSYVGLMTIPYIFGAYTIHGAISIVLPIMGRTGAGNYSEIVLGIIVTSCFLLLLNFIIPFFILIKDQSKILGLLGSTFLVAFLTLILTPLGFPYSSDIANPSPQRFIIIHTDRVFHDAQGNVASQSGGFWMVDMDINSPHSVSGLMPDIARAEPITQAECEELLFCGLPYMIPMKNVLWKTHWISTQRPVISVPTSLEFLGKTSLKDGVVRYSFNATGPDHMNLVISPSVGIELIGWSFFDAEPLKGPKWNDQETFFIYYSCGSNCEPLLFWLDLKEDGPSADPKLHILLSGHFVHGAHQSSVKMRKLISQFPLWTTTSGWTAALRSYVF